MENQLIVTSLRLTASSSTTIGRASRRAGVSVADRVDLSAGHVDALLGRAAERRAGRR